MSVWTILIGWGGISPHTPPEPIMVPILGAVELEKLPLKKDALRKLKLPFDIKSGGWLDSHVWYWEEEISNAQPTVVQSPRLSQPLWVQ